MPIDPPDAAPPLPDLDIPAARAAERQYHAALAGGAADAEAWAAALEVFRLHHPAWPLPLAAREAERIVGSRLAMRRVAPHYGTPRHLRPMPADLLRRLASPAAAEDPNTP